MSESEHYTPERRTMEPPQMTPNNPPNPGHSAERAIAEALTQPGPAHVDNIYSRGAFAPTVSAATSPASTFEPPRAGGMGLGQARAVTSPSPSGGFTPLRALTKVECNWGNPADAGKKCNMMQTSPLLFHLHS
eukprot:symbB.v1.2.010567.t1/scaffold691.1/size191848/8